MPRKQDEREETTLASMTGRRTSCSPCGELEEEERAGTVVTLRVIS